MKSSSGPSPDWIVGVSALELCLRNCSWVENKTLNLYPWDAGTDSGITYMSTNDVTSPREKIRRITPSQVWHYIYILSFFNVLPDRTPPPSLDSGLSDRLKLMVDPYPRYLRALLC